MQLSIECMRKPAPVVMPLRITQGRKSEQEGKVMPAFVIHYDLYKGDRDDYNNLYTTLQRLKAVRATESTWFVAFSGQATELRDSLQNHLRKKDMIAVNVLTVGSGYASTNLSSEAIAWMKKHLITAKTRRIIRG